MRYLLFIFVIRMIIFITRIKGISYYKYNAYAGRTIH